MSIFEEYGAFNVSLDHSHLAEISFRPFQFSLCILELSLFSQDIFLY